MKLLNRQKNGVATSVCQLAICEIYLLELAHGPECLTDILGAEVP
jgi:hypothetical protein